MIIKLRKGVLHASIVLCLAWLGIFAVSLTIYEERTWYIYLWLGIAIFYFLRFLYNLIFQFGKIENDEFMIYHPIPKKIKFSKVDKVTHPMEKYIFHMGEKDYTIKMERMDEESKEAFRKALIDYNPYWR